MKFARSRSLLQAFDFQPLFIEELGWDYAPNAPLNVSIDGETFILKAVAEKRSVVVLRLQSAGAIPAYAVRRKIEHKVAQIYREHILIYTDAARSEQIWQWVRREPGKPLSCREHRYAPQQSGDALLQKLQTIAFGLEEEESLTLVDVTGRLRAAFNVERATKKFYERFKKERDAFAQFLAGIPDAALESWYVSVMLDRLMFIYFIQKKGFLAGDSDYLRHKLAQSQAQGADRFYRDFLCPLFFQGFALPKAQRPPAVRALLGDVPYLNGGIFQQHEVEQRHGKTIQIPDAAFQRVFDFFDEYQWHLDDRPLRDDREINPDVLGYIFEKYINQKQMGAYYTQEDITGYIARNTILPYLLDRVRQTCPEAFAGENAIWTALATDPDRYIYEAVRKGCNLPLPPEIAAGVDDVRRRELWNTPTPDDYALPTEIWRETVARRRRYAELRAKLAAGEIAAVNDLITYNLDIQQFAQDVIESAEDAGFLWAFWRALNAVSVLDPTCGSGAFLFAALNILEPLYTACLERMETFVREWEAAGRARSGHFKDFSEVLARVVQHPNLTYFVLKSIVVNNLYGVDIMAEAVEIAKLRLFLKLTAQIERAADIEPLPDIDFNIRAGNTLVGFATYAEVEHAVYQEGAQMKLMLGDNPMVAIEEKAQDVNRLYQRFREQQTALGGEVTPDDKAELRKRLDVLTDELDHYLAKEYGVDSDLPMDFYAWRERHQPFHWFVEFYGIMHEGGFDVIIGNPPYVELNAMKEYEILSYSCEKAGNLYALVIERCYSLSSVVGRQGYIVPVSSISTDRYESLQRLLSEHTIHYSSFDDRPSRLFSGLEHIRLTIHLIGALSKSRSWFSTCYNKWSSTERPILFQLLRYTAVEAPVMIRSLPKLSSEIERGITKKLSTQRQKLSLFYTPRGKYKVLYSRKVGYFLQVLDFVPLVLDGQGNERLPSEFKELEFATESYAKAALCCLNSNLFYWFITVTSDCRHVNKREVDNFPIELDKLATGDHASTLLALAEKLMADLQANSEKRTMKFSHDTLTIQAIIPKLSKPIIDEIDRVLARHYGFSDEELDFILNYDIKYRMGDELFEDEEEDVA